MKFTKVVKASGVTNEEISDAISILKNKLDELNEKIKNMPEKSSVHKAYLLDHIENFSTQIDIDIKYRLK